MINCGVNVAVSAPPPRLCCWAVDVAARGGFRVAGCPLPRSCGAEKRGLAGGRGVGGKQYVWFCKAICMVLQCERYGFAGQKVTYGAREGQVYQVIAWRGGGGWGDARRRKWKTLRAEKNVKFSILCLDVADYQQTNIV